MEGKSNLGQGVIPSITDPHIVPVPSARWCDGMCEASLSERQASLWLPPGFSLSVFFLCQHELPGGFPVSWGSSIQTEEHHCLFRVFFLPARQAGYNGTIIVKTSLTIRINSSVSDSYLAQRLPSGRHCAHYGKTVCRRVWNDKPVPSFQRDAFLFPCREIPQLSRNGCLDSRN